MMMENATIKEGKKKKRVVSNKIINNIFFRPLYGAPFNKLPPPVPREGYRSE